MYEFVQKLAKKKKKPGWDFNPGPIWLAIVAAAIPYNKKTIQKTRLYKFIRVA